MRTCMERESTSFSKWVIDRTREQTMLYVTCNMIFSVDLVCYGVSHAKDLCIRDCGTRHVIQYSIPNKKL